MKKLELTDEELSVFDVDLDDVNLTHDKAMSLWRKHSGGIRLDAAVEIHFRFEDDATAKEVSSLSDNAGVAWLTDEIPSGQPSSIHLKERNGGAFA